MNPQRFVLALIVGLIVLVCPDIARAHDGDTDANGCHVDSASGMSHCHDGGIGEITPQQWVLIGVSVAVLVAASAASITAFAWMNEQRDEERKAKFNKLYPPDEDDGDWEDGQDWNRLLKRYRGMAVLVPLHE